MIKCERHNIDLEFMAGRNAHKSNLYCRKCDEENEAKQKKIIDALKGDCLKNNALKKIREAEKAMYEYFCDCEVGKEREWASEVYENIRTATRVAL